MILRPVAKHVMESVDRAARWLEHDFSIDPRSEPHQSCKLSDMLENAATRHVGRFYVGQGLAADLGMFLGEVLSLPMGMPIRLNGIVRGGGFVCARDSEKPLFEGFRWPVFLFSREETACLSFTPFSTYVLLAFAKVIEAVSRANFGKPVPAPLIAEIEWLLEYPRKCAQAVVAPQDVEERPARLPSAGDMLVIRTVTGTWFAENLERLLAQYPPEAYCSKSLWMRQTKKRYKYVPAEQFKFNSVLRYLSPLTPIISHYRLMRRETAIERLMPILSNHVLPLFRKVDLLAQFLDNPAGDGSASRILSLFSKTASRSDSRRLAWLYAQKADVESLRTVSALLQSDDSEDVDLGLEIFIDLLGYRHLRKTADGESIVEGLRKRFGDSFARVFADAMWALGQAGSQGAFSHRQRQEARRLVATFQNQCLIGESGLLLLGRVLLHILVDYRPREARASHSFPTLADYGKDCPRLETVLRQWRYAVQYYMNGNEELRDLEEDFRNLENTSGGVAFDVRLLFQLEWVKRTTLQDA
ncbi:MAG: hypothetical protein R6U98_19555 [Pirellulaceae bacterium]